MKKLIKVKVGGVIMKDIRLLNLNLRDFQGGTVSLVADGKDLNVYGDNGVGKTRIASAFSWLLFDKDSLGRSDFEIKNLDAQGNEEHNLEHTVEGSLSVDGETITLKKIYRELWTKKRGRSEREFSGHSTDYFIDGVPVQKKDYQSRVAEITGMEETFRLLTSPTAFAALHWKVQRQLLLDICGDVSDADVIASSSELETLTGILWKRTLDDHKKVITARRSEINKELEKVPTRIDENRRILPDVTGINKGAVEGEVKRLDTALNASKLKLQGIDTGGQIADLSKKLAIVKDDIQRIESNHYADTMQTVNRLNQQISEIEGKAQTNGRRLTSLSSEIAGKQQAVNAADQRMEELRKEWVSIDAETFQNTINDTCPACKQALPSDQVQEARDKALAAFNVRKAERFEEINETGKRYADSKERLQAEIKALSKEHADLLLASTGDFGTQDLVLERDSVKLLATAYSEIPGYKDFLKTKAEIEKAIAEAKAGVSQDAETIKAEIFTLETFLKNSKENADKFAKRESGEMRIAELMAQEKTLATEFEKLEHELYLCDLFVRTKVSMLSERINNKFEIVKWKLYDVQVNQALSECCVAMISGIPFDSGLNTGARIAGGCDIVRTLQSHYEITAPLFLDNRESVTVIPEMNCQVISLYVSENDKALRIEKA